MIRADYAVQVVLLEASVAHAWFIELNWLPILLIMHRLNHFVSKLLVFLAFNFQLLSNLVSLVAAERHTLILSCDCGDCLLVDFKEILCQTAALR